MKEKDKELGIKTFSFRLRPDTVARFKVELAQREAREPGIDWTQQCVVNELLEDFLGGKRTVQPIAKLTKGQADVEHDLKRLKRILESGSQADKDFVLEAIARCEKDRRARSSEPQDMPPGPSRSSRPAKNQQRSARHSDSAR